MRGIAFAGNLIVDHIKEIRSLPERSELSKILRVHDSTGGCVCNTGMDFAILDPTVPVQAIGRVGTDADGNAIISALSAHGIDTSRVLRKGGTSFTDVFAEQSTGCRTFFQYGGANDAFDIGDAGIETLSCEILHIGYLLLLDTLDQPDEKYGTRMARLLASAQARGIRTSIDIVSESGDRFCKIVPPALRYVNILAINEIEAGRSVGMELRRADGSLDRDGIPLVLRRLFDLGVKEWAVIHCPEGAFGMDRAGNYLQEASKPLPPGYKVGTVGAGDAFCAGVLLAAYRGRPLADALVYGNASAQVSLRDPSATGSMVSIEDALAEYHRM